MDGTPIVSAAATAMVVPIRFLRKVMTVSLCRPVCGCAMEVPLATLGGPSWFASVSKLVRDVLGFVHLAIGALGNDSVAACEGPQDSRRHHPRLHEHIGVFDGDV